VEQTLKETTPGRPPIFYALLSLFDEHAQREAVQLLRDAVETGAVRDPAAADILLAIVRNSEVSRELEAA
jgi:hypothetical protein